MGRPATVTSIERIKRQERLGRVLSLRVNGWSLSQIGEAENISVTRAHQLIVVAMGQLVSEPGSAIRELELMRLDEMQAAVYGAAINGDTAAVDAVIKLMDRRARLLGLYVVPPAAERAPLDPRSFRVEVVSRADQSPYFEGG